MGGKGKDSAQLADKGFLFARPGSQPGASGVPLGGAPGPAQGAGFQQPGMQGPMPQPGMRPMPEVRPGGWQGGSDPYARMRQQGPMPQRPVMRPDMSGGIASMLQDRNAQVPGWAGDAHAELANKSRDFGFTGDQRRLPAPTPGFDRPGWAGGPEARMNDMANRLGQGPGSQGQMPDWRSMPMGPERRRYARGARQMSRGLGRGGRGRYGR